MEFLICAIGCFSIKIIYGSVHLSVFGISLVAFLSGFFFLSFIKIKKAADAEQEQIIFVDASRFFAREEVRPQLLKFSWVPIRKQKRGKTVEEIDTVKKLTAILKEAKNSFVLLCGEGGCGKTKLLYEFAREKGKNKCVFANWNLPNFSKEQCLVEYEQIPHSVKYIILDDVYRNPRKAVKFCFSLMPVKEKFILATRDGQELLKIIKDFGHQAFAFPLLRMLNIKDLLELSVEPWINSDIKQQLITIANGNPEVLCLAHEFIDLQSKEKLGFDVPEFLSNIKDKPSLFEAIHCYMFESFGRAAMAVSARSVICHGLNRNDAFCKNNFKHYTKLRSMNYFYVKNDELFFKPTILGQYITKHYYFLHNKISPAFNNLIKDANEAELQEVLATIIAFYKESQQEIYKQAAMLLLSASRSQGFSDQSLLSLLIFCDDELKDSSLVFRAVDNVLTLNVGTADFESINRFAIFCAKNKAYDCAAKWWEKLLETSRLQNDETWTTPLFNNLGLVNFNQKQYDEAGEWYRLALEKYKALGNSQGIIQSLTNLAKIYQKKNELTLSIDMYKKSVDELKKINDTNGVARAFSLIAQLYKSQQDLNQARENYAQAAEWYQKSNDKKGLAQVYGNLGFISKARNELNEAIDYFQKTLDAMEKIGDIVGIAQTHNNLALVYQQKGEDAKAIKHFQLAIEKFRRLNDDKRLAQTFQNLALIYQKNENFEEANEFHRRALAEFESLNDKHAMAATLNNLGLIYQAKEEWEKAITFFHKAINLQKTLADQKGIEQIFGNLGIAFQSINKYDEAVEAFERALDGMDRSGDLDGMAQTYGNLGLIYFDLKNYPDALTLLNQTLFFYLRKGSTNDIKKVSGILSDIHKEMDDKQFNVLADGALNNVAENGIQWRSQLVMTNQDVREILNKMKKRKKERTKQFAS